MNLASHNVWRSRFGDLDKTFKLEDFYGAEQASSSVAAFAEKESLFLVDHDLRRANISGLDFIEKYGIASKSILVTTAYEKSDVRNRAAQLGVKILPKALAPYITIEI